MVHVVWTYITRIHVITCIYIRDVRVQYNTKITFNSFHNEHQFEHGYSLIIFSITVSTHRLTADRKFMLEKLISNFHYVQQQYLE